VPARERNGNATQRLYPGPELVLRRRDFGHHGWRAAGLLGLGPRSACQEHQQQRPPARELSFRDHVPPPEVVESGGESTDLPGEDEQELRHSPLIPPRWLRGAARRAANAGPFAPETRLPAFVGPARPLAANFAALKYANGADPPDTDGAAGPNHLVIALNSQI